MGITANGDWLGTRKRLDEPIQKGGGRRMSARVAIHRDDTITLNGEDISHLIRYYTKYAKGECTLHIESIEQFDCDGKGDNTYTKRLFDLVMNQEVVRFIHTGVNGEAINEIDGKAKELRQDYGLDSIIILHLVIDVWGMAKGHKV